MTIISIDIETTGLDPEYCQIIDFAAVIVDTGYASFGWPINPGTVIQGQPFALSMHSALLKRIAMGECDLFSNVMGKFDRFLSDNGVEEFTIVGKNFAGFDAQFLKDEESWNKLLRKYKVPHRVIDLGNLFWKPEIDGHLVPNSETVLRRCGMNGNVSHTARGDAMDGALCMSHYLLGCDGGLNE